VSSPTNIASDIFFDCPSAVELAQDRQWWKIYEDSLPADEREPPEVILESLRRSVGLALRARRADATVGIATTHLLFHPAAVFLVYLAVDSRHRDVGVGGMLFEEAWRSSAHRMREKRYSPLGLIWEVDDPEDVENPAERLQRLRRIRFFERHGGVPLSRTYLQPPLNGPEPVPMRLMFRPGEGAPMPDAATAEALVRAIYFEKYGEVNRIPVRTLQGLLRKPPPSRA
jgi:hypothetical protein